MREVQSYDDRYETPLQRLDRNWSELLSELRVLQTGVQLLTGFLLTLPFQQRFARLDAAQRAVYLIDVGAAATATAVLTAPVMVHRLLFRDHQRARLVQLSHRCAIVGSVLVGLALAGVTYLIFAVVEGTAAGIVAGSVALLLSALLWVVVPVATRDRGPKA